MISAPKTRTAKSPPALSGRAGWAMMTWLLLAVALLMTPLAQAQDDSNGRPLVIALTLDGAVSPASADYIVRGIHEAEAQQAEAVLLEMDTPGGLVTAMRDIIKAILNSPVPVVTYVAPQGARAASAGTYILYASHVAAMAPATNVGAATPVSLIGGGGNSPWPPGKKNGDKDDAKDKAPAEPAGSAEMRKAINDAVAHIRALAEQRGRNADWAEKAVREAVSISAEQALKENVVDLIAANRTELLAELDGREVQTAAGTHTLHTQGARVEQVTPGVRSQFLSVIANPSVALVLLMLGLGGLVMEGSHPGGILPGVVGAICLLLALYAFQLLPVNFAGLGLILLGVVLMVSEAFVPAFGILAIGGVLSLVIGAVILMRSGSLAWGIGLPTIVGIAIAGAGIIGGILWMAVRSHKQPVVSGSEELLGAVAEVVDDFQGRGLVHVHGERWQADSAVPLVRGQRVVVTARHGLTLAVRPTGNQEQTS